MLEKLLNGDRHALARAITLCESQVKSKRDAGLEILANASKRTTNKSTLRLGISGPPGVGKSCLIESLAMYLIQSRGCKIAVLAVDPTSPVSKGSILGDKTRMPRLAAHVNSFVRPSPSKLYWGGVGLRTKEAILLCEAAGYEILFIETVGVGQSEFAVSKMCDIFVVLQQPYYGDELQGIKKGILEVADVIVITKADDQLVTAATIAHNEISASVNLAHRKHQPLVYSVSAKYERGFAELWEGIDGLHRELLESGDFKQRRAQQAIDWFKDELFQLFVDAVSQDLNESLSLNDALKQVKAEDIPASVVAINVFKNYRNTYPPP